MTDVGEDRVQFLPQRARTHTDTHRHMKTHILTNITFFFFFFYPHSHETMSGLVMTFSPAFHFPSVVTVVKVFLVVKLVNEFICRAHQIQIVC